MTKRYYSATTGGFYHKGVHSDMPTDAVEVSEEDFAALMAAQAAGKEIIAGDDGAPVAAVRTQNNAELLEHIRRKRDRMLCASDFTQLPDSPLSDDQKAEWQSYRAALRKLPQTYARHPEKVVWPDHPGTTKAIGTGLISRVKKLLTTTTEN